MGWVNVLLNAFRTGWDIGKAISGANTGEQFRNLYSALAWTVGYQNDWNNVVYQSLNRIAQSFNVHDSVYTGWGGFGGKVGDILNSSFRALTNQIIPATAHDVYNRALSADKRTGGSLGRLWSYVFQIHHYVDKVRGEVYGTLAPEVAGWHHFKAYWDKWLAHPSAQLQHWSSNPDLLSQFIVQSMAVELTKLLRQTNQKAVGDALLAVLLTYLPDDVSQLDNAAVALLNSGSY